MCVSHMAPLAPTPASLSRNPPHASTGLSGIETRVKRLISAKIILFLLLGTAGIFCLGVIIWKLGSVLRHFTKGRILREKKEINTRYIKTWYGWIPEDQYNARYSPWRQFWGRRSKWLSWKSTDDYRWIWWDPTLEETRKHANRHAYRWWFPRCLKSYEGQTAKSIWNPNSLLDDNTGIQSRWSLRNAHYQTTNKENPNQDVPDARDVRDLCSTTSRLVCRNPMESAPKYLTFPLVWNTRGRVWTQKMDQKMYNSALSSSFRIHERKTERKHHRIDPTTTQCTHPCTNPGYAVVNGDRVRKKYREWSARLQLGSLREVIPHQSGLIGRPGSPRSDLLARLSDQSIPTAQVVSGRGKPTSTEDMTVRHLLPGLTARNDVHYRSIISRTTSTGVATEIEGHHDACKPFHHSDVCRVKRAQDSRQAFIVRYILLDAEIRFVDKLDRKLEWLLSECHPGRRAFHFATLPNHWLNAKTWIVYDPPCRTSSELIRQHGDPRFRKYLPEVYSQSKKRKFPIIHHRRATTPRIDSWRLAVNRHRQCTGIRDFVQAVDLYESSADEPPDGAIDPASWILRKPPQGFGMSSRQKNAYYDGGAGWFEKLDEWRRVGSLYRIRRGIQGGGINRSRARKLFGDFRRVRIAPARHISVST